MFALAQERSQTKVHDIAYCIQSSKWEGQTRLKFIKDWKISKSFWTCSNVLLPLGSPWNFPLKKASQFFSIILQLEIKTNFKTLCQTGHPKRRTPQRRDPTL